MTVETLMQNLEAYYGEYRDAVRPIVVQWLRSQRPTDAELSRLFAELIKTHTSQYRTPPDVAIMRPVLEQIQGEMEHEHLSKITAPLLPDATELADINDSRGLIAAVFGALLRNEDPRDDAVVRHYLEKYGVQHQISKN